MISFKEATNSFLVKGLTRSTCLSFFSSLILILALLGSLGCGGKAFTKHVRGERGLQTGQALLVGDEPEGHGYGLYSYLLFEAPPTPENSKLFQSVIVACIREIPNIERLEKQGNSRENLNVTYIPITDPIPQGPAKGTTNETLRWWSHWILNHYNYIRAREILAKTTKNIRRGPFLISTVSSVSLAHASTSPFLIQDLSDLPSDTHQVAYEWVLDFIDRVSNPQRESEGWNEPSLIRFTSDFRDSRALSLADSKINFSQEQLNRSIQISDTWISDTWQVPQTHFYRINSYSQIVRLIDY